MLARIACALTLVGLTQACGSNPPKGLSKPSIAVSQVPADTRSESTAPPAKSGRDPDCSIVSGTDRSGSGFDCPEAQIPVCGVACHSGDAGACLGLLTLRLRGKPIPVELFSSQFEALCSAGNPLGCRGLGQLYVQGAGRPKDDVRAVELYEKACSGKDAVACVYLSVMLELGRGVAQDKARALALLETHCDQGVGPACNELGYFYVDGSYLEPNHRRAFELFTFACQTGQVNACDSVGEAYEKGWHVARDLEKAEACYRLGCEYWGGGGSCESAARVRAQLGK